FLTEVKERHPEELITIDREADLRFEISALLVKLDRAHNCPITLCPQLRDVEGKPCAFPLLSNLFASRRLCALAFNSSVERVGLDYDAQSQAVRTPAIIGRAPAPVKQVIRKGSEVNLFEFPVPLPYHMEGGRTILGSVMTTVDNHSGNIYNCAYQTLRLIGPRKVTVGLGEGTHNWERYRERVEATGAGLPAVAWIGHHPAACMGALTRVAIDIDEYSVIGGALGEPFRLTPSET